MSARQRSTRGAAPKSKTPQDKSLIRVEVEKCDFDGCPLRLVTGWFWGNGKWQMRTRLTRLPLRPGQYRGHVPPKIRSLLSEPKEL